MIDLKNEKGSITLFVLVSCVFFIASVACVQMYMQSKRVAVDREYRQIKSNYEGFFIDDESLRERYIQLAQLRNIDITVENTTKSGNKLIVELILNTTSSEIKTIKYGWGTSPSIDTVSNWTFVEKESVNGKMLAINDNAGSGSQYHLFVVINNKEFYLTVGEGAVQIQKGKIVTGSNAEWKDETNEYPAIIPVGFCVVKGAGTIEEGLVISDVEDDDMENTKHGNQFVWIPVNDYSKFHLIEGYSSSVLQKYISQEVDPSREAGDILNVVGSPMTKNSTKGIAESVAMYNSVKNNHGFYIARFEAGIEGKIANSNLSLEERKVADGKTKPLSQKGVGVWNNIIWGGTQSDVALDGLTGDDTADGAVKVARSMYTKSNICGVTSTLCYGVQWDAVMNFIDDKYEIGECNTTTSFVANSANKGNYTGTISTTGYHAEKNIYDLAGNVWEWTMEAYNSNRRIYRGGYYNSANSSASARSGYEPGFPNLAVGFRLTLYL